jgi:hypothetical protein
MTPILYRTLAALALVVVHNMFRMEIGSCAQPVLEEQPGKYLDFVWYLRLPNVAPMNICGAVVGVERFVSILGCEGLAGQL